MATFPSPQSYLASLGGGLPDPAYSPPAVGDYITGGYHDFDGIDDRLEFGRITSLEFSPADTFTVSLWVNHASGTEYFVGVTQDTSHVWTIYRQLGGFHFYFRTGGENPYVLEYSSLPSSWSHILVVKSGASVSAYVNGSAISPSAVTNSNPTSASWASSVATIGNLDAVTYNLPMEGGIAEVAVWSSDQSSNVATIYNSRIRHDLMLLSTPPDLFYAPLSSYGDDPGGAVGGVFEAAAGNHGTGVNMSSSDAVPGATVVRVKNQRKKVLTYASGVVSSEEQLGAETVEQKGFAVFP